MEKLWILVVLSLILISMVYGMTATQQVKVTVVPGIISIYSPVDKIYQKNNILVTANVNTPLDMNGIIIIDNGKMDYLCSSCKSVNKEVFFSNGKHEVTIIARFQNREEVKQNLSFIVDSNSDIYILSGNLLKKATAKDIADVIRHYNFTLLYKNEMAPEDSCSVKAQKGNATINSENFGTNNVINFYSITSIGQGQGDAYVQGRNKRISYKFKVNKTIENSDSLLNLSVILQNKEIAFIEFNKLINKTRFYGQNFSIDNMNVYSIKGCSARKGNFWLIEKQGKLSRSIDETRNILLENQIFIAKFSSLKFFFSSNWIVVIREIFGLY